MMTVLASFTNHTASVCLTTTCVGKEAIYRSSVPTVLYMFDGNTNSAYGLAAGTLFGSPVPTVSGVGYIRQALSLAPTNFQYMIIPPVDLARQSFTIELWFYINVMNMSMEMGLFSQCDSRNVCLSLSIRNGRLTFWLDSMNSSQMPLIGSSLIVGISWTHVAVVYDAVLLQQRIYLNGQIDGASTGIASPYRGTTIGSTTTIGQSVSVAGVVYANA